MRVLAVFIVSTFGRGFTRFGGSLARDGELFNCTAARHPHEAKQ